MLKISVKNGNEIKADFSRFADRINGEVIKIIDKDLSADFWQVNKRVIESEGGRSAHGKWRRLSPKYREWKEKKYPGKTIMRRTDRAYKSLTQFTSDSIKNVDGRGGKIRAKLGTQLDYPGFHQDGIDTKRGKKTRRMIDPGKRDLVRWMKIIHDALFGYSRRSKIFDNRRLKIDNGRWDKAEVE